MRCFIATWPDETTQLALAALADDLRQRVEHRRRTDVAKLHLTLAFIAQIDKDAATQVVRQLSGLRFRPFDWPIDTLGFFAEAGVVWAGTDGARCAPLLELARRGREILDQLRIDYDDRPLSPHVTLLRGVRRFKAERVVPSINWHVDSIALYRSAGGRYTRVA